MTTPTETIDFNQVMPSWLAACNAHDAAAFAAHFADEFLYDEVGFKLVFRSKVDVEQWMDTWFAAYPDLAFTLISHFVLGNRGILEWEFTGTLAHSFPGVPDSAVGDTRTVRGISIATFNATGKITQQRDYWNAPDLIR